MTLAAYCEGGAYVLGDGIPYTTGWESGPDTRFVVDDLEVILYAEHRGDVRFTPAVVYRGDKPVARQRRLIKSKGDDGILALRSLGFDVFCSASVVDYDLKKHKLRRLTRLQYKRARDVLVPRGIGLSSTRSGLRCFRTYAGRFPLEEYRGRNIEFQTELQALLGTNDWDADPRSAEWTRVYRTPWCSRDGAYTEPWIDVNDMVEHELTPVAREDITSVTTEVSDIRLTSDPSGLDRARAYLAACTPPPCGVGKCRSTLWNMCLQCHLFGLGHEDALALVFSWAGRSAHGWTSEEIAETVERALTVSHYASGARLA